MELRDYQRILRKRWRSALAVVLLALAGAAAVTVALPRQYEASTRMFVSTTDRGSAADLYQGSTFAESRVQTYASVMTSDRVLRPVIRAVGMKLSPTQLASDITVDVPTGTVLLEAHVTNANPRAAFAVAKALARIFPETIASLETANNTSRSPVKVSVIGQPTLPASPVEPKPTRNILLGGILGIVLGMALAFVRESLDSRIKSEADCAKASDATIIGGVGYDGDAPKHPLVIQTDPHSGRAEAFRSLRTNLQYVDAANHPRSIVFTSSVPNEGKTTTAANLATTMSAAGSRVCIVEADLRRPRLLSYMGLEGGVGLTTVLIGQAKLTDVLQEFAGMSVLGAGHVPPNPSELLGSSAMRDILQELEQQFDVVIIDAPPLLPVTDAAVLSTIADGTVVVVGVGSTKREQLGASISALEHVNANILGLVLNKLPTKGPDSYNYTYYREGYRSSSAPKQAKPQKQRKEEELKCSRFSGSSHLSGQVGDVSLT